MSNPLWWGPKVMPADPDNYETSIIRHGGSALVPRSFLLCLFGPPQIKAFLYKLWHHPSLPHTRSPDWCSRRALVSNRLFGHHSSPITIIYPTVENCSNCSWSFGATRDSSRTPAQSARADPVSVSLHTVAAAVAFWINKMSQPCDEENLLAILTSPPWAKPSFGTLIVRRPAMRLICRGCDMLAVAASWEEHFLRVC